MAAVVTTPETRLHTTAVLTAQMAALVVATFSLVEASISVPLTFAILGAVGFVVAQRFGQRSALLFLVTYSIGAVAAIALYYYYIWLYDVPYLVGGSDDLAFEWFGLTFAQDEGLLDYGSIRGQITSVNHNSVGYVYLVGLLAKWAEAVGTFHTLIPRIFNVWCLGIIAVLIYNLSLRLGLTRRIATLAGLAAALLPIMLYTALHTYRDTFIALLLITAVYLWTVAITERGNFWIWALIATAAIIVVLFEFRRAQAIVPLVVAALGMVARAEQGPLLSATAARDKPKVPSDNLPTPARHGGTHRTRAGVGFTSRSLIVYALAALAVVAFFGRQSTEIVSEVDAIENAYDFYQEYRLGQSDGFSGMVFGAAPPLSYGLRTAYASISPLPIIASEPHVLWISLGTVLRFLILPFVLVGLWVALRHPSQRSVAAAFVVLFLGVALVTFQDRHIVQYTPFALVLAGIGFQRHPALLRPVLESMIALGMLGGLAYLYLVRF